MSKAVQAIPTPASGVNRRGLLTAAGAAGAAVVVGSIPTASASHSTSALPAGRSTPIQKLWQQYIALVPEVERLSGEADLAFDRLVATIPPIPDELISMSTSTA